MVQLNSFRQTLSGNSDWPAKVALAQDDDLYRQRRPFAKVRCHQFYYLIFFPDSRNRLRVNHQPEAGVLATQSHHVASRWIVRGLVKQVAQHHATVAVIFGLKPPRHIPIAHIECTPAWVVF